MNLAKGRTRQEDVDAALGRLSFSTDLAAAAADADFLIEAATEELGIKQQIFARLGELAPAHAILATNSSTRGSSKVTEASGRSEQVCNMHFFNPAVVMKCVEVVRNEEISQATMDTTVALHASGIATLEDIETTTKTALGHPMGPFGLMDRVGLDVIDFIAQVTYAETNNDADRPDSAITALVEQGRLGRKSCQGWYSYPRGGTAPRSGGRSRGTR